MSRQQDKYDLSDDRQIVNSGYDIVDRVMEVLIPGATEAAQSGRMDMDVEGARQVARDLLEGLFQDGVITCPKCKAADADIAQQWCCGDLTCPMQANEQGSEGTVDDPIDVYILPYYLGR